MRRYVWSMVAALALGGAALAHEGHEHKVMGKVVAIDDTTIAVDSTDGKRVTGALDSETRYRRGKSEVTRGDVQVGERVVLIVVEAKGTQKVKQVLLGATGTPNPEGRTKH